MERDGLSATFAALADPTRRAILSRLRAGQATVGELAAPHRISLPAVSRHLRVLEQAGLVVKGRDARWRPCRLDAAPLREVDAWLEPYRVFLTDRLDRLADQLASGSAGPEHRSAPPVRPARDQHGPGHTGRADDPPGGTP